MTPSQMVERDRQARHEAGRKIHRPNGGIFVVEHPLGIVGEIYQELLDALNYWDQICCAWRLRVARWLVWTAARLVASEIGDKNA